MDIQAFYSLVSTTVVLFLLIATGFVARKTGIIDDASSKRLSKLIIYVGQPMMILHALTNIEYSAQNVKNGFFILAVSICLHIFLCVFAFFASKGIKDFNERKIAEFSMAFTNSGFIGFPIFRSVFGDIGEFWGAFFVISFHLFIWTRGMMILARGRDDIKVTVKKIFINPGTIPCVIGIILYLLTKYITIPRIFIEYSGYLSNLCAPISSLIVGALIATRKPKQIFLDIKGYYVCLCRLIVMPLIVCLIAKFAGLNNDVILFMTTAAALPSATNLTMFSELYDITPGYAAQTIGLTSVLTIATMPLVILAANAIILL